MGREKAAWALLHGDPRGWKSLTTIYEIVEDAFPGTPRSTIRTWLSRLEAAGHLEKEERAEGPFRRLKESSIEELKPKARRVQRQLLEAQGFTVSQGAQSGTGVRQGAAASETETAAPLALLKPGQGPPGKPSPKDSQGLRDPPRRPPSSSPPDQPQPGATTGPGGTSSASTSAISTTIPMYRPSKTPRIRVSCFQAIHELTVVRDSQGKEIKAIERLRPLLTAEQGWQHDRAMGWDRYWRRGSYRGYEVTVLITTKSLEWFASPVEGYDFPRMVNDLQDIHEEWVQEAVHIVKQVLGGPFIGPGHVMWSQLELEHWSYEANRFIKAGVTADSKAQWEENWRFLKWGDWSRRRESPDGKTPDLGASQPESKVLQLTLDGEAFAPEYAKRAWELSLGTQEVTGAILEETAGLRQDVRQGFQQSDRAIAKLTGTIGELLEERRQPGKGGEMQPAGPQPPAPPGPEVGWFG